MADRQGRDRHRAWCREHGDALFALGLPLRVWESKACWTDFLENGHLHFHEDPGGFSFEQLSVEQREGLHRFLEREYGSRPMEPVPPLLAWLRVRAAPDLVVSEIPITPEDALRWLASRGAHAWLVRHHELVLEAADQVVSYLASWGLAFDADRVRLGAALHDAGKVEHPDEMLAPGHAHEAAGEAWLLGAGFPAHVARACVTHAAWSEERAVLEDRLVALADKLWKGKRDAQLESALVDELAARTGRARWEVFDGFDALCERVADGGPDRLRRSDV